MLRVTKTTFKRSFKLYLLIVLTFFSYQSNALELKLSELLKKQGAFYNFKLSKSDQRILALEKKCSEAFDLCLAEIKKVKWGGHQKLAYKIFFRALSSVVRSEKTLSPKELSFLDLSLLSTREWSVYLKALKEEEQRELLESLNFSTSALQKHLRQEPSLLCLLKSKEGVQFGEKVLFLDGHYKSNYKDFPCRDQEGKVSALLSEDKWKPLMDEQAQAQKNKALGYSYSYLKSGVFKYYYSRLRKIKAPYAFWKRLLKLPAYFQIRILENTFYRREYKKISYAASLYSWQSKKIAPEALVFVVKSLVALGKYKKLLQVSKKLNFVRSSWSEEILLMRALSQIRLKQFEAAFLELEKMKDLNVNLRLSRLFWSWAIAKHLKKTKELESYADLILKEYPLSYYSYLVGQDRGLYFLADYKKPYGALTSHLSQNLSTKEIKELVISYRLQASDFFSSYYNQIEERLSPEQRALFAIVFFNKENFLKTMDILNRLWTSHPQYLKEPFLSLSYPQPHMKEFKAALKTARVEDAELAMALSRQESAFNVEAQSSAEAMGLTQLIWPTAKEMARFTRTRLRSKSQLFQPALNLKLGVHYLGRLLYANKGYLPFALASYNAGPGNVYKWAQYREELMALKERGDVEKGADLGGLNFPYASELWVEELPWSETRFYVKAVLRNYAIYLNLNRKDLQRKNCSSLWRCPSPD